MKAQHGEGVTPDHRPDHGAPANVVVIGGANVDIKSRIDAHPVVMHSSNRGVTRIVAGGVGRNVADNLARLGVATTLITAVGRDTFGERLIAETARSGLDLSHVVHTEAETGSYTAVLDGSGELLIGVSAMHGMEELTPAALYDRRTLIARASALILDCNIPVQSLAAALRLAAAAGVPAIIDTVSVAKSERLRAVLRPGTHVHTVTPNLDELAVLAGRRIDSDEDIIAASAQLNADGIEHVWVRLGARGSFMSSVSPGSVETSGPRGEFIAAHATRVIDVTGAGDAMLAAYVHAILRGIAPNAATRYGHLAAAITVASDDTVCGSMSAATLDSAMRDGIKA